MATPVIAGWFTTGSEPQLLGSRCTTCGVVSFPPVVAETAYCANPSCDGTTIEQVGLSRRGTVWSYTDARYQPPAPYIPRGGEGAGHRPFALAAVELPEGLVVLGQVADGYGVDDLQVGAAVELVIEELTPGVITWRWQPTGEPRT